MIPSIHLSTDAVQFVNDDIREKQSVKPLTVSNVGLGPLTIRTVVLDGPDSESFSIQDEACTGTILTTGKFCSLSIHFAGDEPRYYNAQLTIWDNAPGGPESWP